VVATLFKVDGIDDSIGSQIISGTCRGSEIDSFDAPDDVDL